MSSGPKTFFEELITGFVLLLVVIFTVPLIRLALFLLFDHHQETGSRVEQTATAQPVEALPSSSQPATSDSSATQRDAVPDSNNISPADLEKRASSGDASAEFLLGNRYMDGKGVDKNTFTGIRILKSSVAHGEMRAATALALIYLTGQDAPRDIDEAKVWLDKAASNGEVQAQYLLGHYYETRTFPYRYPNGSYGPQDNPFLAYAWLTLAAQQGSDAAQKERIEIGNNMGHEELVECERLAASWRKGKLLRHNPFP